MRRKEYGVGDTFGLMTVLREVETWERRTEGGMRREFILQCACGTVIQRPLKDYITGRYISCGCHGAQARRRSTTTHGMSGTRPYRTWRHMVERCDNPHSTYYKDYGGRGITYPTKWATFRGFWDDMHIGYSDDLELDRVDPLKDYSKHNCRWSTESVQGFNQRRRVTNTSGRTGVYKSNAPGSWWAEIRKDGQTIFLGTFHSFEEACAARELAEIEVYGFSKS